MNIKRNYTEEFIQDAIELVKRSDKSLTQVAKSLGVPTSTLRQWMGPPEKVVNKRKYSKKDPTDGKMLELKKELADIKLERDILKKAVAIFSKPQE